MQKFGVNLFMWEEERERNWVLHDQTLNVHIDFIAVIAVIVVGACTLCYLEFLFEEHHPDVTQTTHSITDVLG